MPLQNRADPAGRLFATAARGLFTGNRGAIHDPDKRALTGRGWTTKAWIICDCGYKGRKRVVFGRNAPGGGPGWTNIFFLDETTALAAGHRPCFQCRSEKAREFADCFGRASGVARPRAAEIDARLHAERALSAPQASRPAMNVADCPDGVMFRYGTAFVTRKDGRMLLWSFDGYRLLDQALATSPLLALTPPTAIAILAAGYRPAWHPSADI